MALTRDIGAHYTRCAAGEHVEGRWISRARSLAIPAPQQPCCLAEGNSVNANGYCAPRRAAPPNAKRSDHLLIGQGGRGCTCTNFRDNLEWRPLRCRLPAFDAYSFCAALGNGTLVFVGDSTMMQTAELVRNAVAWGHWRHELGHAAKQPNLGCAARIYHFHSDTLAGRHYGAMNRGEPWYRPVLRLGSAVSHVVLTVGAHIRTGLPTFEGVLQSVASQHEQHLPHARLIWKTQQPAGCGPRMLEKPPDEVYWRSPGADIYMHKLEANRSAANNTFNWQLFRSFDAAARAFWADKPRARERTGPRAAVPARRSAHRQPRHGRKVAAGAQRMPERRRVRQGLPAHVHHERWRPAEAGAEAAAARAQLGTEDGAELVGSCSTRTY